MKGLLFRLSSWFEKDEGLRLAKFCLDGKGNIEYSLATNSCPKPHGSPETGRANSMIYEIMSIIPSKYSDSEIDGAIANIETMFTNAGAKVEKTTNLGKIKLAYPIDHIRFGTYVLSYIAVDGEKVKKIDQDLRLSEFVLRHMIVARPDGIPAATFRMSSYVPPLTAEGRRAGEREERPRTERPTEAVEKARMSTAELNDKLDQILDSDIMKNI